MKKNKRLEIRFFTFVFFCLICFSWHSSKAQYSQWKYFNPAHGLGDVEVYTIFEVSSNGDLWFGTKNGATRYNGTWKNFNMARVNTVGNIVHAIAEDNDGHIWFGTEKGVKIFQNETPSDTLTDSLANKEIWTIIKDKSGHLWFGTSKGAYCFNQKEDTMLYYNTIDDSLALNEISAMVVDNSENIWIGTSDKHIYRLDKNRQWGHFELGASITDLFIDMTGGLWAATNGASSYFFNGENWTQKWTYSNLVAIEQDWQGDFWFAADEKGVYRYDSTLTNLEIINYLDKGLIHNDLYDVLEDSKRNMWIATKFGGVCRYNESWQTFLEYKNSLPRVDTTIVAIEKDDYSNIWFGTSLFGAYRYDGNTFEQPIPILIGTSQNPVFVTTIENGRDSLIWFGTLGGGIISFDGTIPNTYKSPEYPLANNFISSILEDSNGNLWIGTYNGVTRYNCKNQDWETFTTANSDLAGNRITAIFEDHESLLWFATWSGVSRFDGSEWETFNKDSHGLASDSISSIAEDDEGNLWFGTEKRGVIKYNCLTWESINTEHGLADPYVNSILYDPNTKKIWIGTDHGVITLFRYDNEYQWQLFNLHTSGLPNDYVNSIFLDLKRDTTDDTIDTLSVLWFGTNNGAALYLGDAFPPETSILIADGYTFKTSDPIIEVGARDNLSSLNEISFSYKINKIDENTGEKSDEFMGWSPFSFDTNIRLHSLVNGKYEIQVRARDADGNIDPTPDIKVFEVEYYYGIIGASGGSIDTTDGERSINIYIPPKAFDELVNIEITSLDSSEIYESGLQMDSVYFCYNIVGTKAEYIPIVNLNSLGTILFKDPAIIQNKYLIYHQTSADNSEWLPLGGTIDLEEQTIAAIFKSFGKYALVEIDTVITEPGPIIKDLNCRPRVFSSVDSPTRIIFTLGKTVPVTIKIYNVAGRMIRNLTTQQILSSLENSISWDGKNDKGEICVSGLYIVCVLAEGEKKIKTVAIVNN